MTDDALIRLHCAALPQRPPGSSASGDEEADVALVASYSAEEALSRPYRITVDFSIPAELTSDFVVEDLLRNRASLHVTSAALDRERFFDGIVSEASFERAVGNRLHFRVVLRPSLWLLTLREDARIFQEATAPDIVRTLLGEAGLASTTHWHVGAHPQLQFTVLYKESPLNFIQRLCEDAGIFYYFTHDADGHQLHFSDDTKSFESLGDPVSSSLAQASELATPLVHFRRSLRLRTSEVSLRDFDVDAPHTLPQASSPIGSPLPQPFFDYPGGFTKASDGQGRASAQLRSLRHDADGGEGMMDSVELFPGKRLTVLGAAEADANGTFVVSEMTTMGVQHHAKGSSVPRVSRVKFRAFTAEGAYLPPRTARRPRIFGIQTAQVVGAEKADQSIDVDHLGRIKVHFHWDRLQPADEKSSCYLRVSQIPLGGSMILPRVGWEVSVAFLEGDPDRPIVLGRVYNAENMPPLTLPDNKAFGALTSMSSPGGAGKNEISLGDGGGQQGFSISAQKDFNMTTGYDQTESVTVDDEAQVNANLSRSVAVDETVLVMGNQTASFGNSSSCKICGNQTVAVSGNETLNSTANTLEKVSSDRSIEVAGNRMLLCNGERINVTGAISRTVGTLELTCTTSSISHSVGATSTSTVGAVRVYLTKGDQSEVVTGAKAINVAAAVAHTTKGDFSQSCEGSTARLVGGVMQRKVKGDLTIKAPLISLVGAKATLKGGGSQLSLAGGPITIKAGKIVIKGGVIKKAGSMKLG